MSDGWWLQEKQPWDLTTRSVVDSLQSTDRAHGDLIDDGQTPSRPAGLWLELCPSALPASVFRDLNVSV